MDVHETAMDVDETIRLVRGNACCLVAAVGFALNYLPVKKYDTGDGIFFCAAMSLGILGVGLLQGMLLTSTDGLTIPKFEPLAALGGAMWMLGNLMCPYIIQIIGLGLGLTMWDLSNMLVGWFIGHFGLFGVHKEVIQHPLLNCVGLVLASVSLVFFSLSSVLNSPDKELSPSKKEIEANVAQEHNSPASSVVSEPNPEPAPCRLARAASDPTELVVGEEMRQVRSMRTSERVHSWLSERVHPNHRTCSESDLEAGPKHTGLPKNTTILQLLIGSAMAVVAGTLFGTTFVLPTDLLQGDFGNQHSKSIMDYVFSHFTGIFLMAAFALVLYAAIRRKSCYTPLRLVMPALSSGVIWGIAQVAWFQANLDLGFSVSFPVIASLPGVIGLLIGICCFGEVGSFWSRVFAALGLLLRIPGVIFIALSA